MDESPIKYRWPKDYGPKALREGIIGIGHGKDNSTNNNLSFQDSMNMIS